MLVINAIVYKKKLINHSVCEQTKEKIIQNKMKSINKYFNQTIDNCCNLTEEETDLYGLNNNQSKTK